MRCIENRSIKELTLNDIITTRGWIEDFAPFGVNNEGYDVSMVKLLSKLVNLYLTIKDQENEK